MKHRARTLLFWLLVSLIGGASRAQRDREPLHAAEIDQLRDAAMDPEQRLRLFVQFARARLISLNEVQADPKAKDRTQQEHDLLQDFLDIYDELNDNIDNFVQRREDMRKPLRVVIEGDSKCLSKLHAAKISSDIARPEDKLPEFLLTTAISTVVSSAQDHRQLLEHQEETAKARKKH